MAKVAKTAPMDEENDWRAEDDLRTLIEAEKVKADPKRLKAAMAKHKDMSKALANIGKK